MDALRRKIARRSTGQTGQGDADRAFRLSFARAARDVLGLVVDLPDVAIARRSLAEVVELPPERALIALLDRAGGDGVGVMVLSAPVLAGMVEHMTTGGVTSAAPLPRRPTRTDAAMVSTLIDAALSGLGGGWCYAGMLDDPHPLGLLLDDAMHEVIHATVRLADGAKEGAVFLVLPELQPQAQTPQMPATGGFPDALAARVETAEARMDAVIARLSLPLARMTGLMAGEVLPLTGATVDLVRLVGVDGRTLAEGRLGQHRGLRAIRIADMAEPAPPVAMADRKAG